MSRSEARWSQMRKSKRPWSRRPEEKILVSEERKKQYRRTAGHRQDSLRSASTRLRSSFRSFSMAHKKGVGSSRNGRDSTHSGRRKRLEASWSPAARFSCGSAARVQTRYQRRLGKDDTLFAKIGGIVQFEDKGATGRSSRFSQSIVVLDEAKSQSKPATAAMDASHSTGEVCSPRRAERRRWRYGGNIYLVTNPTKPLLSFASTTCPGRSRTPRRRRNVTAAMARTSISFG